MPVLARAFEAAGFSTVLVSMMPFWSGKVGTPRTLAVEHPFSRTLGIDAAQQLSVIHEALDVLATSTEAGTIVHSSSEWPVSQKEAMKQWQPQEPAPIIGVLAPQLRKMLRRRKR